MGTSRFAPVRENRLRKFPWFSEPCEDNVHQPSEQVAYSHEEHEHFYHVNLKETNVKCSVRLSRYLRGNFDYTFVMERILMA